METNLPCSLFYQGNGVLVVQKPVPGAPGQYDTSHAHFALVKLGSDGRMHAEYVPGFEGLTFDAEAWAAFMKGAKTTTEFTWPAWSSKGYEEWRKHQLTQ